MYKRILPLLLLIFVMVISGCIGQGPGVGAANGIVIKDFYFDYSPIYERDQIGLNLEVQNVGGKPGRLKRVTVFGVESQADESGPLSWGRKNYSFELSPGVTLAPPDPTTGFEGELWSHTWLPQAPSAIRTSTDYDFEVRVEYRYSTTYTGTIRIIDSSYLRTLSEEKRDKLIKQGGVIESKTTGGPMSVSAASGRHFIVRGGEGGGLKKIRFKVTNSGSGYPYLNDITTGLYKVHIKEGPIGLKNCDDDFTMSRGKTGTFACDIGVPASVVNKVDKKFSVTLVYDYYVDSATTITVNPIYEEGTIPTIPTTTPETTTTAPETTTTAPGCVDNDTYCDLSECDSTTDNDCPTSTGENCDWATDCCSVNDGPCASGIYPVCYGGVCYCPDSWVFPGTPPTPCE